MSDSNYGGGKQFTQWYNPPMQNSPSAVVGSMPPQPWVRSVLDARRMMYNRTPNAEYPSGYLGTIIDRRQDKLFDSLQARVNQRSYQRGVHLGERIDPGDYLWPEETGPFAGLERQATTSLRYAPRLQYFQPTPSVDGKLAPRASESVLTIDEHRASQLAMLKPKYGLPAVRRQSVMG